MAIHICSEDFIAGGKSYNGEWKLDEPVQGVYKLAYLNFNNTVIPWIWTGVNSLSTTFFIGEPSPQPTDINVGFNLEMGFLDDKTEVASLIQSSINGTHGYVTVTYVESSDEFKVENTGSASHVIFYWDLHDTTAEDIFEQSGTQDLESGEYVMWTAKNVITSPRFIECYIKESSSCFNNAKNTLPTLLIQSNDVPYIGQEMAILRETTTLTIHFVRREVDDSPVALRGDWDMIFVPKFK